MPSPVVQIACPRSALPWPLRPRRKSGSLVAFAARCPSCGAFLELARQDGQLGLAGDRRGHDLVGRKSLL